MFHFYNTCLISFNIPSLVSGGIIVSAAGFVFTILSSYNLVTASAVLFPKNSLVTSAALSITFLEGLFSSCFPYLLAQFLAKDKNPYSLTYFLNLGSIEYCCIAKLNECVISIYK